MNRLFLERDFYHGSKNDLHISKLIKWCSHYAVHTCLEFKVLSVRDAKDLFNVSTA